jgi:predicted nucleic acid-binding protein
MNRDTYFADTWFWIALLSKQDQHHDKARQRLEEIKESKVVTSEMILTELANMFSRKGSFWRRKVAEYVKALQDNAMVVIVEQEHKYFADALLYYELCHDRDWGLTDCSSFSIMKEQKINLALTDDHHFEQAGFTLAV